MKKKLPRIFLLTSVILIIALGAIGLLLAKGGFMKSKYVLKWVTSSSENGEQALAVREGDVILEKFYGCEVLPAALDFTKPITRKKITNAPFKESERLLRIKELGEDAAVVAILYQTTSYEGADTLVTTETEELITVKYGEEFSVYAKEQVYDSYSAVMLTFIIEDTSKPQEQKTPNFCTECGNKLIPGDKFCRECGTPVQQ